ncbi:hypothetical protein AG1IA_02771 [Rhizoctonia solani AG-1 IA]|uniref:Uncharacterized protein n=1 Tax=Thanatephorus cucumeris (strain AG1-IA) TaxID=983506 RepID=L8X3G5_THACA|nr:hypothetical protein AG1IA_02771 [Rhizoctonia solani AG-1 IA]
MIVESLASEWNKRAPGFSKGINSLSSIRTGSIWRKSNQGLTMGVFLRSRPRALITCVILNVLSPLGFDLIQF